MGVIPFPTAASAAAAPEAEPLVTPVIPVVPASLLMMATLLFLDAWDREVGRACLTPEVERLRRAVSRELEGRA